MSYGQSNFVKQIEIQPENKRRMKNAQSMTSIEQNQHGQNIGSNLIKDLADLFAVLREYAKAKIPKLCFRDDSKF